MIYTSKANDTWDVVNDMATIIETIECDANDMAELREAIDHAISDYCWRKEYTV